MTNDEAPEVHPGLRNQKQMEPLRDERLHEETPHRRTDSSDQTGCRLTDESTTPPYQRRPRMASGIQQCCGRQPQHCLRCVRSHPMDGAPRLGSRRVRRLPAPAYRLLFFSARAGPNPWACSFLFGPWSSAKRMTVSSFISTGNPYADRTHP